MAGLLQGCHPLLWGRMGGPKEVQLWLPSLVSTSSCTI